MSEDPKPPTKKRTTPATQKVLAKTAAGTAQKTELVEDTRPKDPVQVATKMMLERAFAATAEPIAALRDGLGPAVVVEVPGPDWVKPIAVMFKELLSASDVDEESDLWPDDEQVTKPVAYKEVRAEGDKKKDDFGSISIGSMLAQGKAVVGFSQQPERHLPRDLIKAADFRMSVVNMDSADIGRLTQALTGQVASIHFPESYCRLITAADLRLARRPNQSADDFVSKLITMVAAKARTGGLTLENLHGMPEATEWGLALTNDLREFANGRISWSAVDRGACLYGPPGTGKTTFARALAATCRVPLIAASLHQWQARGHLGDLLGAMRQSFEQARSAAPCILFIDEIDAFGDRNTFSDQHRDYSTQVVNGFLEEIDGIDSREGVVLLGACNHIHRIDPAILRSGRLDRMIPVHLPDAEALVGIMRVHVGQDLSDDDLARAAELAVGGTGADVEKWVRGAKRLARAAQRNITIDDLIAEIKGTSNRPDTSTRLTAYHEAGHAVVMTIMQPGIVVSASIRPVGRVSGGVIYKYDAITETRSEVIAKVTSWLGGRAAEELVFGNPSGGAGGDQVSDLARATSEIANMLASRGLGFGPERLVWQGEVTPQNVDMFLRLRPALERTVSEILNAAYSDAMDILQRHRTALDEVASTLIERQTISGDEIENIMSRHQHPDEVAK